MGWRDRILSRHGLLHRVVRRGAPQPEDGDLVAPAADDAELRALRSELARELERVARGQTPPTERARALSGDARRPD